ncbi:MAG: DUF4238 domain-containing protein [Chitinophagaceae bacterium]|nr:DUF4238 domain-containing protein [Chitinophagaceae bacterium]
MSIPINHHYVSQCHIHSFFNRQDKKVYCYDKVLDRYYFKPTTKSLFSEDYSNTRMTNNIPDHQALEEQLNLFFEQDFQKHSLNVVELAENPAKNNDSKLESLYYLAGYGLIADVRFPTVKKSMDDGVNKLMLQTAYKIRLLGDEAQAQAIKKSIEESKKTKYSNLVDYTEIAARRLIKMGELDFNIYRINTDETFLLPDIGCILMRDRINNYFNPYIQEVAIVGIPLTPKIFVFACSKKIGNTSSGVTTINDPDSGIVKSFNRQLFDFAAKTVVTSDKRQLEKIVNYVKDDTQ